MTNNYKFILSGLLCTIFKIGYFKYMPGTLGSLIGILIGVCLRIYHSFLVYMLIILFITLLSFIAINIYQSFLGSKEDRSEIIIDEFIGQQVPLFFIEINILNIILSFIFFRFFDILKIFPCNYIDKNFKNSTGIIADDVIAGIQTLIIIYFVGYLS